MTAPPLTRTSADVGATAGRTAPVTRRQRRRREALIAYAFLAPSAIPLAAFVLYPMAQAAWTSMHEWNLLTPMEWVGFGNYTALLTDSDTLAAFAHTLYYIAGTL